jgi:hypothetical protein
MPREGWTSATIKTDALERLHELRRRVSSSAGRDIGLSELLVCLAASHNPAVLHRCLTGEPQAPVGSAVPGET